MSSYLLVKGQAYIDKIARGEKPEIDGEEGTAIKQDSVDSVNHLETAAAQSCIQMDYSREMVAKAIQIFIAKNGNRDYKGKDLCKILFDIEENPEQLIMNISDTNAVDKCVNETNDVVKEEETLGVGNRARYPFSGGGLENRKKDGIPKEQRNIWYPKYPYILLLKGQSYDAKLTFQRKLEAVDPSEHMGGVISEINRLGSIAAQMCLEMDLPVDKVKQAIDIYCQRNGDLNFKAKDLCEMLFEIEESQDKTCTAVIDVTATTVPVASFGYEDFPVLYNSFIEENQMSKMCMYKQDHMTLLAYHHLVSCPQCATEISISQAI